MANLLGSLWDPQEASQQVAKNMLQRNGQKSCQSSNKENHLRIKLYFHRATFIDWRVKEATIRIAIQRMMRFFAIFGSFR